MKIIIDSIKTINNTAEIIVIGDTHIGSANFCDSLLKKAIDYVLEKENRYCILNGDILDCTFKDGVGNVYENAHTPSVSLGIAHSMLKSLADAGKILCSIGGNHDHIRSMKLCDISYAQQLATMLGIADKFSADSVVLLLTADSVKGSNKGITYKIFASHGNNGGGSTMGAKANALNKMSDIISNADIYVHSHTHAPLVFKDTYYEINDAKKSLTQKERLYVNTNAWMSYFNSYGESKLYRPQSNTLPIIKLKAYREHNKYNDKIRKVLTCEL